MNVVEIEFSRDEAIVLFEFLTRFAEEKKLQVVDEAEAKTLWNLQCELEKILTEPFQENYEQIIKEARNRLRDTE